MTIIFENFGEERDITRPGTSEFSFRGSNWSGGVVTTFGITSLYASGSYTYHLDGGGEVTFDAPIDSVRFFYVHGFDVSGGTATAFDAEGNELGSAASHNATFFNDQGNFVEFDPEAAIARITFSDGAVDDFTFTTSAPPGPEPIQLGDLEIRLEEVATGLSSPVFLTHAGDGSGRLFVVDQSGLIRVIRDGELLETPFLDIRDRIVTLNPNFDERGALGLAFHPDFESNGRFFVRYSGPREGGEEEPCTNSSRGCHEEILAEFRVSESDPDVADPESERILFRVDEPEFNHNSGQVLFGPDGLLYFSLGDGGGANDGLHQDPPRHGPIGNGQNLETALGSLLRIDVDGDEPYAIPDDNPFVEGGGLDEIYAYGFRNPYRFSFDRESGELWLADVGQLLFEEINIVERGGNYGWVIREGAHCFDPFDPQNPPADCPSEGMIDPVAEYDHSEGTAVIGGFVYRGSQFPELVGKYVFGEFTSPANGSGRILYLDTEEDRGENLFTIREFPLVDRDLPLGEFVLGIGEDESGELYVLTSATSGPLGTEGSVYRIESPSVVEGGAQVIGDCNRDGTLDVSDPVCVFRFLFTGQVAALPCGAGDAEDPGNLALLDWQGDERL
ncbi:MAG TPA: PQQ-dependent sugar dehydrogenase, partial [Planctomycetota bacterium]|nr:PQQ-dependent sugar dehydrogenase [Planctomycetota bacterium]